MFKNIFAINPSPQRAMDFIFDAVLKTLKDCDEDKLNSIQIEFKYAEFIYFDSQQIEDVFRDQPQQVKKRAGYLHQIISDKSINNKLTLLKLSQQGLVRLNDLGKRIYKLESNFNESEHKRFYHIREFLVKLCRFNEAARKFQKPNIYQEISEMAENKTFRMFKENQLRIDISVWKSEDMDGRYTYEVGTEGAWVKVNKIQQIRQQIDLMMCERTFRLGINQEKQTELSYSDASRLQNFLTNHRFYMVRIKRALRVIKSDMVEFSLSEVLEISRPKEQLPDLVQMITADIDVREKYIKDNFYQFYNVERPYTSNITKHEIEAEFTKNGVKKMKKLIDGGHLKQLTVQLEIVLEDLNALFYADHATKTREVNWLKLLINKRDSRGGVQPGGRLDNQYGSYMRDILYEAMNAKEEEDQ